MIIIMTRRMFVCLSIPRTAKAHTVCVKTTND